MKKNTRIKYHLQVYSLFFILLACFCYPANSYTGNQIKEIRHELLPTETQAEIVLYEGLSTPIEDYKDKNGLVVVLKDVGVDPPKWKFLIEDKKVLKEIIVSQYRENDAKIFFHVRNPGKPIPYTITTSGNRKTVTVSFTHAPEEGEKSTFTARAAKQPASKAKPAPVKKQEKASGEKTGSDSTLAEYEDPKAPPPPNTLSLFMRTASSLALVIGFIFLTAFAVKKFFPNALKNLDKNKNFRVIDRQSIGQRREVVVMQIYGKKLLLGVTPSQINFLAELEPESLSEERTKEEKVEDSMVKERSAEKPFKEQLSKLSKENIKTGKRLDVSEESTVNIPPPSPYGLSNAGITVADALSTLSKNKVSDVGSHKKSLESALGILHKKINQIDKE